MSLPDSVYKALGDTNGILRAAIDSHDIEHLDFEPESEAGNE